MVSVYPNYGNEPYNQAGRLSTLFDQLATKEKATGRRSGRRGKEGDTGRDLSAANSPYK
ncbi:hypothetical protein RND71_007605 [Anisodus tanguticus]|uniref:Uncharacterized protein n=1 Tax=Anisodus tanguticus TaxID=243964 RepID=A0AAE1VPW9_9SOLA|nr:hypothetical protein RND71_007605 [Anisodus tanguticus]